LPFLQFKKNIHRLLFAVQDAFKFSPAAIANANDVSERDRLSRNLCGDGSAKEAILEKDPNLSHIAWVKPHRHIFSHIGGKRQRYVSKALKVNTITTNLPGPEFFDQQ
jgi:hypothetical protein